MPSDRKLRSCRANGRKAKGAPSPKGIERSKYNALTHGLRADTVVCSTPRTRPRTPACTPRTSPAPLLHSRCRCG